MQNQYSPSLNTFFLAEFMQRYENAGTLPDDAVPVSDETYAEYSGVPPQDKVRGADDDGNPVWLDIPPPSAEDLLSEAENSRRLLIDEALSFISDKQWQGKAAMGRLKDGEREQYNAWLDYLDALDAVDISAVPDVNWPSSPEK